MTDRAGLPGPVADLTTIDHGPLCGMASQQAGYWRDRARILEDQLSAAAALNQQYRQVMWGAYVTLSGYQGDPGQVPPDGALTPGIDVSLTRAAVDMRAGFDRARRDN